MKTITQTINLYEISELKDLNPAGYAKALEAERERHEEEWHHFILEDRFSSICEDLGEPDLELAEWDPFSSPLIVRGWLTVPSEFSVTRVLNDEDPIESVQIGEDRSWTGWRYYIHSEELTDEEGGFMLERKRALEKEIAQKLYGDLELFTAEHTLVEYSECREALYEINGTEHED